MTSYCSNLALASFLHVVQNIIVVIQIIAPILLLASLCIKLFQAMMHPDEKKNIPRIRNAFLAAAIIFFVPTIVNVLTDMIETDDAFLICWQESRNISINFQNYKYYTNDAEKKYLYVDEKYETGRKSSTSTISGNYSKDVDGFMQSIKNTVDYAREHNYHYGNSNATPPTTDGLISCDRLEAKALWDIGYTDQRPGGVTVADLGDYLTARGWSKSTNINDIKYGSIVVVSHPGHGGSPTHAFTAVSYNPSNGEIVSYDEGAEWRIHASQPFVSSFWNQSMICGVYNMN